MDPSRVDVRTVALALLCIAVVAFAAATLDSTTDPNEEFGSGYTGQDDERGGDREPAKTPSGDSADGRSSFLDLDLEDGAPVDTCVSWLGRPVVTVGLLAGLVGVFLVVRRLEDTAMGLVGAFLVGYPGFLVYLLLTACNAEQGQLLDLSDAGRPSQEGGGLTGGEGAVTTPELTTQLLFVVVVGTLVAVAALVLTGDHDQTTPEASDDEDDPEPEPTTDVRAVGTAAGRAADRIERDGEFENEVYRAWAAMTDNLTVDHPDTSTPAEFAAAATAAGMDEDDVGRLTDLFGEVRYGGAEPTADREAAAVETLRRIEAAYAGEES